MKHESREAIERHQTADYPQRIETARQCSQRSHRDRSRTRHHNKANENGTCRGNKDQTRSLICRGPSEASEPAYNYVNQNAVPDVEEAERHRRAIDTEACNEEECQTDVNQRGRDLSQNQDVPRALRHDDVPHRPGNNAKGHPKADPAQRLYCTDEGDIVEKRNNDWCER